MLTRRLFLVFAILIGAVALGVAWFLSIPSLKAFADIAARPAPPGQDLTVRFLGTATVSISDGSSTLMTDGFFSRPNLFSVLFTRIAPNQLRITEALEQAELKQVNAILVAHSHYDHAMDSAAVAMKTGASVYGSRSTANILLGSGLTENRIQTIKDGDILTIGRFRITVFETPHSPHPKYEGFITSPLHPPEKAERYKVAENYSFLVAHGARRMLVIPSGNFAPGKFKSVKADTVLLGIGTLGKQSVEFTRQYWRETVEMTGAKFVIPIHWDNFTKPLNEPLSPLPRILDDMPTGMYRLQELARQDGVELKLPVAFQTIALAQ